MRFNRLPSTKRKEENLKLVFNWGFKFLQSKFQEQSQEGAAGENGFYAYYFGDVASLMGVDLSSFYKPNFSTPRRNGQKTFNTTFLDSIQLSADFISDFHVAIEHYFVEEQERLMFLKLDALLVRWENQFHKMGTKPQTLLRVCDYIKSCRKIKIPWTLAELLQARRAVKDALPLGDD